jgi:hypothetical protein
MNKDEAFRIIVRFVKAAASSREEREARPYA